jgi:hypothetical protein
LHTQSFAIQQGRAIQDYGISQGRARQDFSISQSDKTFDFKKSMADQSQDFAISQGRAMTGRKNQLFDMAMGGANGCNTFKRPGTSISSSSTLNRILPSTAQGKPGTLALAWVEIPAILV